MKKYPSYTPRPMPVTSDLAGAPGLLRALACDVEQPESDYVFASDYAFGDVTAAQLRHIADVLERSNDIPGVSVDDRYAAHALVTELRQRLDTAPASDGDTLSFISAGTSHDNCTIRVSPSVAALVILLLDAVSSTGATDRVT